MTDIFYNDRMEQHYYDPDGSRLKWHHRFLRIAEEVASWSKDPSTQVGAVLVDWQKHIVGTGYNGFPKRVEDTHERLHNRELKYKMIVHAEVNAIIQAGDRACDATLYVWPSFGIPNVCSECCKVIIQAGVGEVVSYTPDPSDERVARWAESLKLSRTMLLEAGIEFYGVDRA